MRKTVRLATIELMRELGLTTIFGNPGSTELAFLTDWPDDFRYILGLQESVVVGMADGYAQATGRPAFVNLHSAAGVGHGLGAVFTAYKNQTPLVITAGQQARSLLSLRPFLGAQNATEFPKPYVKWSCEPARAEDVPVAIRQAYHMSLQPPCGPTFVSIPCDDWTIATDSIAGGRISSRSAPDGYLISELVEALNRAKAPAIIFGPGVAREKVRGVVIQLAEKLGAHVWASPLISRNGFPEAHPQFAGFLPASARPLTEALSKYDCVLVLGAPAFLLHVPDEVGFLTDLPPVYQITDDPDSAVTSPIAISIIGSLSLAVPELLEKVKKSTNKSMTPTSARAQTLTTEGLSADILVQTVARLAPENAIFVEEAPSHKVSIHKYLAVSATQEYFAMSSGGLGFAFPAAVGISLAMRDRRVIALVGDGSAAYCIQALWTAAQWNLPITYIILNNGGYGVMRAFSKNIQARNIPGINLPGISFTAIASAFGCEATFVDKREDLESAIANAVNADGPTLIEVPVDRTVVPLY